jgi:hypothetical protein
MAPGVPLNFVVGGDSLEKSSFSACVQAISLGPVAYVGRSLMLHLLCIYHQ